MRVRQYVWLDEPYGEIGPLRIAKRYYGQPKPYSIVERTRQFALEIIAFTRIVREAGWRSLSEQLFNAGTSIGANMNEAQQAASRKDFIHKTRISAKEAKETRYWLSLCRDSPHLPYTNGLYEESDAINAILATIIARAILKRPQTETVLVARSLGRGNGEMGKWGNGGMEEWRNGGMEEWRNGAMEQWGSLRKTHAVIAMQAPNR